MTENFEHLQDIESPEAISKFIVSEINNEQFPQVKAHFEWIIENSSNNEVITAATNIVNKVKVIMSLWKNNFSWEIIKSTTNDYHYSMTW